MIAARLLAVLRWVVAPVAVAAVTGYLESRVRATKEQTRAGYETLAPAVEDLEETVAELRGRLEELSRRPPCSDARVVRPPPVASSAPAPSVTPVRAAGRKVPARFDDMLQQAAH